MEPYPTRWRAAAAETAVQARLSSAAQVRGVAGLSDVPNFDAVMAEQARRERSQFDPRARRVTKEQLRDLERQREKHAIRRTASGRPSVPVRLMPLRKGALSGVRFPLRHPVLEMLKMSLNILEHIAKDGDAAMLPQFLGYEITRQCDPRLAVPPYLGNEYMADLTSGSACLVLQAIAENPLPALPASAPDVGFSTYVQGPFGRWATLTTYAPQVAGEGTALAAGPMLAEEWGATPHNMLDPLSAAGKWPAVRPLPLALNAANSAPNHMRAPSERTERGPVPRSQADPGPASSLSTSGSGKRGSIRWDKTGRVGISKRPARPRPYRRDVKIMRVKRALVSAIGHVTELLDHVDALYDALPESVKKRLSARFGSQKKAVSTKAKIFALLTHWNEVDLGVAAYNMLYNAVFDRLQAQASKAGAKLSREHGGPARQLTPSRAAPQDTEGPHGSLSSAVKAVLKEAGFSAPTTREYLSALGWASAQRRAVVPRER